jgi:O-antigen/teichoic acid export membrane protein
MYGLIMTAVARASGERSTDQDYKNVRSHIALSALLVLPFLLGCAIWSDVALRLMYGANSHYTNAGGMLKVLCLAYAFDTATFVSTAILGGIKQSRAVFQTHIAGLAIAVAVGLPLTVMGGITLAVVGLLVVNAFRAVFAMDQIRRTMPRGWRALFQVVRMAES